AMNNCTDEQYWDTLVYQCIPCSAVCGWPTVRRCAALCGRAVAFPTLPSCLQPSGMGWDGLFPLRSPSPTSGLRREHWRRGKGGNGGWEGISPTPPWERNASKQRRCMAAFKFFPSGAPALVTALPPAAVLEQKACVEQEPWLVVYLLLGLCLCALVCSLLLGWTHLRRKGEVVSCQASPGTCHRREDSSKANTRGLFADRLVEAGSVGDGSTGSRVPEPVETCGFCFPGHGSAVQETKSCHSTTCPTGERAAPSHTGICSTGSAGAIPSPDDGHFKIICSPSQEKTPM
ncbi:Tumor necrosis factor receptor superfamily member 13B, partial [Charadrius vociferus]